MKKLLTGFLVFGLAMTSMVLVMGFGGPAPKASGGVDRGALPGAPTGHEKQPGEIVFPTELSIDNFEDGNTTTEPEWWSFGNLSLNVVSTDRLAGGEEGVQKSAGKSSLNLSGTSADWYVGGLGVYLAHEKTDLSQLTKLELDVYGVGPGTGTLRFELIDDDNKNYKVEYDDKWIPLNDDRWVFELPIDWKGWKHQIIQFSEFRADNPGRGDGIWNIEQADGSGGLLQMQIIATSHGKVGAFNATLDNLRLSK